MNEYMLNGTGFHLKSTLLKSKYFSMRLRSYGQCVTRARYLEIPVNTTQSADLQSYEWRPALRTDNSSVSYFDILFRQNQEQYQWQTSCKIIGST